MDESQTCKSTDDYDFMLVDGIRFLESIARYYGPERSIEVWEKMGEAMGKDVQGTVFFKMLTQQGTGGRVYIEKGSCTNAVWAIKAIRSGTGMGLKEAKDAWDSCCTKTTMIDCGKTSPAVVKEMIRTMRDMGMWVG